MSAMSSFLSAPLPSFPLTQRHSYPKVVVSEYRSDRTGIRVLLGEVPSPIVAGVFTLPTETHSNEGLPHTLEHLIFLGSKRYPYKGVLDLMANKCLSEGTNAWTATDYTAYTLSCAGEEGFINLLPVFLDHIMRPTLSHGAFLTEVHNVSADGSSQGVVYSEMQSRENLATHILARLKYELLYPGDSGYRYETGGMLADIRLTSNEAVKLYHRQYYRMDNLHICLTGNVDINRILTIIQEYETDYLTSHANYNLPLPGTEHGPPGRQAERPWSSASNVEPMVGSECRSAEFPADDCETGKVCLSWRGKDWNDFEESEVVGLLGSYLTEGNTSPLEQNLVEVKYPYCSSIHFEQDGFKSTAFELFFDDVPHLPKMIRKSAADGPVSQVEQVGAEAERVLRNIVNKDGMDMQRMQTLIRRELLQFQRDMETSPHDTVADILVEYCVNGDIGSNQLHELFDKQLMYERLQNKDEQFWLQKVKEYFLDAPCAEVRCYPSLTKAKKLQTAEAKLRKEQVKNLGEEELKAMICRVEEAKKEQQTPPPTEVVAGVPFADPRKVRLLNLPLLTNYYPAMDPSSQESGYPSWMSDCSISSHMDDRNSKENTSNTVVRMNNNCWVKGTSNSARGAVQRGYSQTDSDVLKRLAHYVVSPPCVSTSLPTTSNTSTTTSSGLVLHLNHLPSSDFVSFRLCARIPDSFTLRQLRLLPLAVEMLFEADARVHSSLSHHTAQSTTTTKLSSGSIEENSKKKQKKENYTSILDNLGIKDGEIISHESLTKLLLDNTTFYQASIGFDGRRYRPSTCAEFVTVCLTAPVDKWGEAFVLLSTVVRETQLTVERVRVQSRKILNALAKKKRSGSCLIAQMECCMRYPPTSIYNTCGIGQQEQILREIQSELLLTVNSQASSPNSSPLTSKKVPYPRTPSSPGEERNGSSTPPTPKTPSGEGRNITTNFNNTRNNNTSNSTTNSTDTFQQSAFDMERLGTKCITSELSTILGLIFRSPMALQIATDFDAVPLHLLLPALGEEGETGSPVTSSEAAVESADQRSETLADIMNVREGRIRPNVCIVGTQKDATVNESKRNGNTTNNTTTKHAEETDPCTTPTSCLPSSVRKNSASGPCGNNCLLVGLSSTDADYLVLVAEAPFGVAHSHVPVLMVLTEFFSCMEGPLYRDIRGAGFAYGCHLSYSEIQGEVALTISPSVNVPMALKEGLRAIRQYVDGSAKFTEADIEAAKSACVYSLIKHEDTSSNYALHTFLNAFRGLPADYSQKLTNIIRCVTVGDVEEAAKKYLKPIVDFQVVKNCCYGSNQTGEVISEASKSTLCVVTNTAKVIQCTYMLYKRKHVYRLTTMYC